MNIHNTIAKKFNELKNTNRIVVNTVGLLEFAISKDNYITYELKDGYKYDLREFYKQYDSKTGLLINEGQLEYDNNFATLYKIKKIDCNLYCEITAYHNNDDNDIIDYYILQSYIGFSYKSDTIDDFGKILYYFTDKGWNEWLMHLANISVRDEHGYLDWKYNNDKNKLYSSGGEFYISTINSQKYELNIRQQGVLYTYMFLETFDDLDDAKNFAEFIRSF